MWQKISDVYPEAGAEIVVRLKNPEAGEIGFVGASVHQIARFDAEGDIWCLGRKMDRKYIEAAFAIPPLKEAA